VGRDFVVTNSTTASIGIKKRTVGQKFFIGPKASRLIAVVIFGALGLLYMTQSTQGADRSYKYRELTGQKTELQDQHDRLQIEASRLESLNEIDKSVNPQPIPPAQMQSATGVNYVPGSTQ